MYHHVGEGPYSNRLAILRDHLLFLKQNYRNVLPGEELPEDRDSVCLTFDDAPFNFFHDVFPLLQDLKLRAIVGVPTRFILEKTGLSSDIRLQVSYDQIMTGNVYEEKAPFCTWEELRQMVLSGFVVVASHSHNHVNMSEKDTDVAFEITRSKQIIEEQLQTKVTTFIYPFGKLSRGVHERVAQEYSYAMRIGNALNKKWEGLLYRVNADNLTDAKQLLFKRNLAHYWLKGLRNNLLKPNGFYPWSG
jgi:peptidoglycan/xylan/chitin deacetylase (PgdA/CDA1 family)